MIGLQTDYQGSPTEIRQLRSTDGKGYYPKDLLQQGYDADLLFFASVTKKDLEQEAGLTLYQNPNNGHVYVQDVFSLFETFTEVEIGNRLLKVQDRMVEDYSGGLDEINQLLSDDKVITVDVLKC